MSRFTRHELAYAVGITLVTGHKMTHVEFKRLCRDYGEHEPSRVFHLIKHGYGVPIRRAGASGSGVYYVAKVDREEWAADPKGIAAMWKRSAKERAEVRRLNRFESDMVKLQERHAREVEKLVEKYGVGAAT